MLSKWERRWFVLTIADKTLRYYKKAVDVEARKAPKSEIGCVGALVSIEGEKPSSSSKYFKFSLETKERVLSLKCETEAERSAWLVALLAVGAQHHPHSSHLPAHLPTSASAPSPLAIAKASSTSTFVPVPPGLRPGQRFQVEVPTGERFNVTVPTGAGESIEVIVPTRCMQSAPSSSIGGGAGGGGGGAGGGACGGGGGGGSAARGHASSGGASAAVIGGGGGGGGGEGERATAWTLCRRFDVSLHRPAAGLALGLALAP